MKYLHTMIRVSDLDKSLDFFTRILGFVEQRRNVSEKGRFTKDDRVILPRFSGHPIMGDIPWKGGPCGSSNKAHRVVPS